MEAIILAGGKGTRLASRLKDIPKPMAAIGNTPFLEIVLQRLLTAGCNHIILSVGHLHTVIRNHFGSSFNGLPITYVIEDQPLGTGGAIKKSLQSVGQQDVLVLNGDTFVDLDYAALHEHHRLHSATLSIAAAYQQDRSRYGGMTIENGKVVGFLEKGIAGPGWINAGVYAIKSRFPWPATLDDAFSFESDLMVPYLPTLQPVAYESNGYFLDIGVPQDLDKAQRELVAR